MSRSDRPRMAGIRSTADPRWDTAAKNTQATSGVALPNNRRGYAGADHAWPSPECRGQAGWPAVQWGAGDSASRAAIRRRHPPARQAAVSHTSNCLSIGLVEFMAWYDLFSNFYDYTVELVYRRYRPGVVDALGLHWQARVWVACHHPAPSLLSLSFSRVTAVSVDTPRPPAHLPCAGH